MPPDFAADLIVTDANLITLEGDDAAPRWRATAMCVFGGKIVYVGDDATALRFAGPTTRRLALAGRTVVPGFCDAHVHLFWYGLSGRRIWWAAGTSRTCSPASPPSPGAIRPAGSRATASTRTSSRMAAS